MGEEDSSSGLLPTNPGSVESKSDAEKIQCTLLNHGWLGEHIEGDEVFVGGLNPVFDDRRLAEAERCAGATMEVQAACAWALSSSSKRIRAKG
jgi:hypothetical protein